MGFDWKAELKRTSNSAPEMALDMYRRRSWADVWRAPIMEAVDDLELEVRRYGPVQAMVTPILKHEPSFNVVYGAAENGTLASGELVEALDWVESFGLEFHVPVTHDQEETPCVEDELNRRGYERCGTRVFYVRDSQLPTRKPDDGVELFPKHEFTEGFGEVMSRNFGLDSATTHVFDTLPGRIGWYCCTASDVAETGLAAAAMVLHGDYAQLVFAATDKNVRNIGCHAALIDTHIESARRRGVTMLFAETSEPGDELGEISPGGRNLLRARFFRVSTQTSWCPPRL